MATQHLSKKLEDAMVAKLDYTTTSKFSGQQIRKAWVCCGQADLEKSHQHETTALRKPLCLVSLLSITERSEANQRRLLT